MVSSFIFARGAISWHSDTSSLYADIETNNGFSLVNFKDSVDLF